MRTSRRRGPRSANDIEANTKRSTSNNDMTTAKADSSKHDKFNVQSVENYTPNDMVDDTVATVTPGSEYPLETLNDDAFQQQNLIQCGDCGRRFAQGRYEKHIQICAKVNSKSKRKVFDSSKMRISNMQDASGQGLSPLKVKSKINSSKQKTPTASTNKPSWKAQSESIRDAIKCAKAGSSGNAPENFISSPDPSLIPCPHCNRRFNAKAADRHIPQCQNIVNKPSTLRKGAGKGGGLNGKAATDLTPKKSKKGWV